MSDWRIRIPHQTRGQPLGDLLEFHLDSAIQDAEERRVVAGLIFDATSDPDLQTVGDFLDRLQAAGPGGRRLMLDHARRDAGLKTITEIDENQRLARESRDDPPTVRDPGPPRDESGRAVQECAHPGCTAISSTPEGALRPTIERRWWCDRHRDQAPPEDLEPWKPPTLVWGLGGGFESIEQREAGARHYAQLEERSREEREKREEQYARERKAIAQVRERWEEEGPPINIGGIWVKAGGKVVDYGQ